MGSALALRRTMEALSGLEEGIDPGCVVGGIVTAVPALLPEIPPRGISIGVPPWRGPRPCSPDGLPYLGRHAALDNLISYRVTR